MRMYKEPKGRTRFLSPKEEALLLKALGERYALWARLAILTGLRQDEQFKLRWTDVDLERGFLTLPETKAGEVQYVPLNEEAKAILKAVDSWQRSARVFPEPRGGEAGRIPFVAFGWGCLGVLRWFFGGGLLGLVFPGLASRHTDQ